MFFILIIVTLSWSWLGPSQEYERQRSPSNQVSAVCVIIMGPRPRLGAKISRGLSENNERVMIMKRQERNVPMVFVVSGGEEQIGCL